MAPTPVTAWGLLELSYHVFTVEHKFRVRTIMPTIVGGHGAWTIGGGSKTVDGGARDLANLIAACLPTTGEVDSYVFYHDNAGVLEPVETASLAIAGTATGLPGIKAAEQTVSMRTTTFKKARFQIMDGIAPGIPQRVGPSSGGVLTDLGNALISTASLDPGNWAVSRDNSHFAAIVGISSVYNRKMMRRYGL